MSMKQVLLAGAAIGLLSACERPLDFDLRDLAKGFDTSQAVANMSQRPRPDDRGVISYPNYQVVVAKRDDTMGTIAARFGLDANELARYNGVGVDVALRRDELVALPRRLGEPSTATGAAPLDVTAIATTALDRAGPQVTTTPAPTAAPAPAPQAGPEPVRHKVATGETVYSIARLYGVPVRAISEWNGLGPDLSVREGQFLLIPQNGQTAPVQSIATQPAPGAGSAIPVPPSAATPLPSIEPSTPIPPAVVPKAPDLGTPTPAVATPSANARLAYPVQGTIIREYAAGRNEGIDIGVPAGTTVKAADSGTVAAVTTDTSGVAIVVIKHADNLLTVYTNIEGLSVAKGDTVSRGQAIGTVIDGDPSFLHFEVRKGLQSANPADFL
uniref:peptidoglycan DD-metalloendopeptidase family protein n=1 Tax=Yoonia sp. TaxID=2212373 RepID=UPI004047FE1F